MSQFSNAAKIAALKRELAFRKMVYPKRVKNGSMLESESKMQLAIIEEMIADYTALANTERLPLGD